MNTDLNLYKKNGFLIKKNLISKKTLDKVNKIIKDVVYKEKGKKKSKADTQTYDNYHFVYKSSSSKNKEILKRGFITSVTGFK